MKNYRTGNWGILALFVLAVPAVLSAGTISGKVAIPGVRDQSNVLVYIAAAPGQFAPMTTVQLNQHSLAFQPRVLPIVVGTTVNFLNSDDVQHNVFTPSSAGDFFNLGTWPKGQTKSYTFTKMGKVELLCNVHHEMRAYILSYYRTLFSRSLIRTETFASRTSPRGTTSSRSGMSAAALPQKPSRFLPGL